MSVKKKLGNSFGGDYNERMSVSIHIQSINLNVSDIRESEAFYNIIYDLIGLTKKENSDDVICFWGPFATILVQQKDSLYSLESEYRVGPSKVGIRLSEKKQVDQLFLKLKEAKFTMVWEPKEFDYTENYYSFLVLDPDDNKLEFIFDG